MGALEVLHRLEALGVSLEVAGDKVRYRPASRVPPDLLEAVRQHKPEIMASLAERDDGAKRTLAARDRLMERLRVGQVWLTEANDKLCQEEHVWDTARQHFAEYLHLWDCMERQLRELFHFRGCVHGAGQRCPADAVMRCQACAGSA